MRITIAQGPFLPVPPLLGGAVEKVWFNLGQEFARRGHQVTHLSRRFKDLPPRETIEGVAHHRVSGFASPASFGKRLLLDFLYAARVRAALPAADVLVTHTFWLPVLCRTRRLGIPYVHVARYPKGQMKLYRHAALQTVSAPIRDAILAEDPSAADRVRVIPYPLADRYFIPSVSPAEDVVLYTGRVHPEKGIHLLLGAFAKIPSAARANWKLVIVGPHEVAFGGGGEAYLDQLRGLAAPVASQVEFAGRIFDETKLIAHYRRARVFVYPSLAEKGETFGLSVLEGMAAGCAPLVSNLACFQDFVQPDVNGLVFDHRLSDACDALARSLARLMSNPAQTQTIREAAWQTAQTYTLPRIADQFLEDFARLVAPVR